MARVRKTITFKPEILKKIDEIRVNKSLSTQINDDYEEKFKIKKLKGGKKNEK